MRLRRSYTHENHLMEGWRAEHHTRTSKDGLYRRFTHILHLPTTLAYDHGTYIIG
ncbi:hypothetical protein FRC12_000618 [Ceratobasidium sp. 428]|nr:hypothetical protein FRC12_000618 [Ceratobasidium sp. 428]